MDESKPIRIHGYCRGVYYYEETDTYADYFYTYNYQGAIGIFESLVVFLDHVNGSYNIYDLGSHVVVKEHVIKNYKNFD